MKTMKHALQVGAVILTLVAAGGARAATPVPVFTLPIDFNSVACANYGDFQSCSAQYLNFLAFGTPDPSGQDPTYVLQSSEGVLKPAIVVLTGDNANVDNSDVGANIENAYNQSTTDSQYGTYLKAGASCGGPTPCDPTQPNPIPGEVNDGQPVSNLTAWDISLNSLIGALTDASGVRHDLLFFFDNNQTGTTEGQNILASALVCVRKSGDINPVTGASASDVCYELVDENGTNITTNPAFPFNFADNVDPTLFNTSLHYGDPMASDQNATTYPTGGPVMANGTICVDNNPPHNAVAFNVQQCPAGSTLINNNLGSNQTEFILGLPELNNTLESKLAAGYDLVTIQLSFLNNNDGQENVFILAGAARPTLVPEPGTLFLLGLGVFGLAIVSRRRSKI